MKPFLIHCLCLLILSGCSQEVKHNEQINVFEGSIESVNNFSSNLITERNIDVWLPKNYSSENKYAVLYMHDGQMLFDSTTTWNKQEWGVDEVVSSLLNEGEIRNTIVVGIWNTEFRHSEYFPQKPFENLPSKMQDSLINQSLRNESTPLFKTAINSDKYLEFIVTELKPYIDNNYATHKDKNNTMIAGSSMGGLISLYAVCEYPEIFGGAACLSTHWLGTFDTLNNPIPEQFATYLEEYLPKPESHRIYFDYGTETLDRFYEPYQKAVDTIMIKKGYDKKNWTTLKFEGENHSEKSWKKRLHIPLKFLLKKQK